MVPILKQMNRICMSNFFMHISFVTWISYARGTQIFKKSWNRSPSSRRQKGDFNIYVPVVYCIHLRFITLHTCVSANTSTHTHMSLQCLTVNEMCPWMIAFVTGSCTARRPGLHVRKKRKGENWREEKRREERTENSVSIKYFKCEMYLIPVLEICFPFCVRIRKTVR